MKLTASHGHRHHVIQLHLGHEWTNEFLGGVHYVEQVDSGLNSEIIENRYGDLCGNVACAASQSIESGVNEICAAPNRFHAVGDGKLQIAVTVETQFAARTFARDPKIFAHVFGEHAARGVHTVNNIRSGGLTRSGLLTELIG